MSSDPACELCTAVAGVPVHEARHWRVVRPIEPDFPAFYRLVWRSHLTALSAVPADQRDRSFAAIAAIDEVLRRLLQPARVNIASLGNFVPHLHWHVVARFEWDSRFPQPIWCAAQREVEPPAVDRLAVPLATLDTAVAQALHALA